MTPEQLAEAYRAGASIESLSFEHGMSFWAVRTRLRAAGVTMRPRGPVPTKPDRRAHALRAAGRKIWQIALALGVSERTVFRRLAQPL